MRWIEDFSSSGAARTAVARGAAHDVDAVEGGAIGPDE